MSQNAEYPRTLIVGVHYSGESGPGTFLSRIFSAWPTGLTATVAGGAENPDWARSSRHYRTGALRFPFRAFSRLLVPGGILGPMRPSALDGLSRTVPANPASLARRMTRYPWRLLLRSLGGGDILYCTRPTQDLLAWAHEFKPSVIYGHASSLHQVMFLRHMQRALRIPLVLHVMDDFPEIHYREGIIAKLLRPYYLREFTELVRSADAVIAISGEMAQEYSRRYHRPFLCLPMPVDLADYRAVSRSDWNSSKPFRVQFGGRVGWALQESLADVAKAIDTLRAEGVDVVFDVLTFQPEAVPNACREVRGVTVEQAVPPTHLPLRQAEADTLLICLDFDPKSIRQARYSLPSKTPGCLASGTPTLVYAPAGSPVLEYARREGWGQVVDRRDPATLVNAIRELVDGMGLREKLGRTAKRLATQEHDAVKVSERLRNILTVTITQSCATTRVNRRV